MTAAEVWLRARVEQAPPSLMARMVAALPSDRENVPEALSEAALHLYAEVARGAGGREDALPLLAADALFTHAFQAQAELQPSALDALIERCQGGLREIAS